MLSCSIWFSAPSFCMGGGLESRCVGRVYGADGSVLHRVYGWVVVLRAAVCAVRLVPYVNKITWLHVAGIHFISSGRCAVKQP